MATFGQGAAVPMTAAEFAAFDDSKIIASANSGAAAAA
jgi:hypothetical protein